MKYINECFELISSDQHFRSHLVRKCEDRQSCSQKPLFKEHSFISFFVSTKNFQSEKSKKESLNAIVHWTHKKWLSKCSILALTFPSVDFTKPDKPNPPTAASQQYPATCDYQFRPGYEWLMKYQRLKLPSTARWLYESAAALIIAPPYLLDVDILALSMAFWYDSPLLYCTAVLV
jgi:hypothetical protein